MSSQIWVFPDFNELSYHTGANRSPLALLATADSSVPATINRPELPRYFDKNFDCDADGEEEKADYIILSRISCSDLRTVEDSWHPRHCSLRLPETEDISDDFPSDSKYAQNVQAFPRSYAGNDEKENCRK